MDKAKFIFILESQKAKRMAKRVDMVSENQRKYNRDVKYIQSIGGNVAGNDILKRHLNVLFCQVIFKKPPQLQLLQFSLRICKKIWHGTIQICTFHYGFFKISFNPTIY